MKGHWSEDDSFLQGVKEKNGNISCFPWWAIVGLGAAVVLALTGLVFI